MYLVSRYNRILGRCFLPIETVFIKMVYLIKKIEFDLNMNSCFYEYLKVSNEIRENIINIKYE